MKWCCCDVYVCQDWQCLGPNCHCCFDVDVVTNDVCNRLDLILEEVVAQKLVDCCWRVLNEPGYLKHERRRWKGWCWYGVVVGCGRVPPHSILDSEMNCYGGMKSLIDWKLYL